MKLVKIDGGYMYDNDPKFEELSKGVKSVSGDIVYYVVIVDHYAFIGKPKMFYETFLIEDGGRCFSTYFDKVILYSDENVAKAVSKSATSAVVRYKFINREESR